MIYTELVKSLYDRVESKPVFVGRTSVERELAEFVTENSGWIRTSSQSEEHRPLTALEASKWELP